MTHENRRPTRRAAFVAVLAAAGLAGGVALRASAEDLAAEPREAAFDTAPVRELAEKASKLTVDEKVGLIRRLKRDLTRTLLAVPDSARAGWTDSESRTDAGFARLLERGLFEEGLLTPRGGGCYWSFTKRSHSYDEHPQLELQQWRFSAGFYGGAAGVVAKLDATDVRTVGESSLPPVLTGDREGVRKAAGEARREEHDAAVGDVYAVRTYSQDEYDVLVAFQVVQKDDLGVTIAWRILRQWDPPKR